MGALVFEAKRDESFPSTVTFLVLWIPAGFVLGTLTLLGPVRWWANICRFLSISQKVENSGVFLMIGALFMISGYAARIIVNILEVSDKPARGVTAGLILLLTGGTVAAWMHPALMSASMAHDQQTGQFTFGPYPDEQRMVDLKRDGYTIVTLLHPAVVPFEPKLLADEKSIADRIGVPLIHVPMLPWVSGNTEALARIKQLAADRTRRYYVHCYLGQDRVRVVRHALEESGAALSPQVAAARRSLRDKASLERGRVYRLGAGVYVTGYPTDDEFMRYVLSGEIRHVVTFLDPNDPEERQAADRERQLLKQHDLPFDFISAPKNRFDARRVRQVVESIGQMRKPVLVHEFLSPSSGSAPWTDGFIQTFSNQRTSLSPTLFIAPLRHGRARVVSTHVAIGPRPNGPDFRQLARRGVIECIHVGRERVIGDARSASKAGLSWKNVPRDRIVMAVRGDSTYYIYGSEALSVRTALERAYPKPVALTR